MYIIIMPHLLLKIQFMAQVSEEFQGKPRCVDSSSYYFMTNFKHSFQIKPFKWLSGIFFES